MAESDLSAGVMDVKKREELINRLSPKDLALGRVLAELHYMGSDGHPQTSRALDAWLEAVAQKETKGMRQNGFYWVTYGGVEQVALYSQDLNVWWLVGKSESVKPEELGEASEVLIPRPEIEVGHG